MIILESPQLHAGACDAMITARLFDTERLDTGLLYIACIARCCTSAADRGPLVPGRIGGGGVLGRDAALLPIDSDCLLVAACLAP